MKPRPRIRKMVKWGGVVVAVVLVMVWIGSGWWTLAWTSNDGRWFAVSAGKLTVSRLPTRVLFPPQAGWDFAQIEYPFEWAFGYGSNAGAWAVQIPLWFPIGVVAAASGVAWRLDTLARRRARLNLCPKCHYDRTGLAAVVVCPECGAIPGIVEGRRVS